MEKLIINFTPTGMTPSKEMTPHIPVSVNEIIEDVHRAVEIGITITHLHARNETNGTPTYRSDVYARIIEGIRSYAPDLIICVSLSGRNFNKFEQRVEPLFLDGDLKPDMGSLTLSSLNFNKIASINPPEMIQKLASEMMKRGILPELEAFDTGMINYARYLERKGFLKPPHYFTLLFGNIACAQADLLHAGIAIRDLPPDSFWALAGIGNTQLQMNSLAIAIGGGVRVGLEDNIWFDSKRTKLATNTDLLLRIHRLTKANEREIMTSQEMRKRLHLQVGHGKYGRAL